MVAGILGLLTDKLKGVNCVAKERAKGQNRHIKPGSAKDIHGFYFGLYGYVR